MAIQSQKEINPKRIITPLFFNGYNIPNSPTDFIFNKINVHKACELNAICHSRLPNIHWSNVVRNRRYICYGLEFKGAYFASAIWSDPVAANRFENGDKYLELRRMAIFEDAPHNTATWMLARMRKDIKQRFPELIKLISYQDTDVHNGTIYKADNWVNANYTKGMKWNNKNRNRNKEQSLADKIRWEYNL